jgi:hypothetical protein
MTAALAAGSACSSGAGPAQPQPQALHVAGSYQITKTGVDDTCGGPLTPVTVAGTVTHAPGGSTLVLNDGFTAFAGTIGADGTFTIPATSTTPHDGAPIVTTFEQGRFDGGIFTARVTLAVDGPSAPQPFAACRVVQAWRGVRG